MNLQSDPGPYLRQAALLSKGLEELQRISDILEECTAFWDNLDVTLGMVNKFRDQTSVLLKASNHSQEQANNLLLKLSDYTAFWDELKIQCSKFVEGSQKSGENMRKFVNTFNETMVRRRLQNKNECVCESIICIIVCLRTYGLMLVFMYA